MRNVPSNKTSQQAGEKAQQGRKCSVSGPQSVIGQTISGSFNFESLSTQHNLPLIEQGNRTPRRQRHGDRAVPYRPVSWRHRWINHVRQAPTDIATKRATKSLNDLLQARFLFGLVRSIRGSYCRACNAMKVSVRHRTTTSACFGKLPAPASTVQQQTTLNVPALPYAF